MSALTLVDSSAPDPNPACGGAPSLTHELIESILIAAAHFVQHQRAVNAKVPAPRSVKATANLGQRRVFVRCQQQAPATDQGTTRTGIGAPPAKRHEMLARLALVTIDIRPVHRYILPLLPHAWPPAVAISGDRADVLAYAHSLGLLDRWFELAPVDQHAQLRQSLIVLAATNARVLEWFQQLWPLDFQTYYKAFAAKIQHAMVHAAVSTTTSNVTELLDFWAEKSGIDLEGAGLLSRESAKDALMYAFRAQHVPLLYWWGNHTHLLTSKDGSRLGHMWDYEWVKYATQYGHHGVLEACIELQEEGKVSFVEGWDPQASPNSQSTATQLDQSSSLASVVPTFNIITLGLDEASMAGRVSSLERLLHRQIERGDSPKYSETAMDLAHSPDVLDWWATKSGLPLKYSTRALHEATIRRDKRILDWWLTAYQRGTVPELKYDEWIMAFASALWKFDAHTGKPSAACCMTHLDSASQVEMVEWWDKSGLDLKLPSLHSILQRRVPSPIDICLDVPVLEFWLDRAKRLAAAAASSLPQTLATSTINIAHFFPRYTQVAMHRAAYWNATPALGWWFHTASFVGLPLRYTSHRIIEFAAMSWSLVASIQSRNSALELLFQLLPEIRFRGSLLDWAQDARVSTLSDSERALVADFVCRLCKARAINAETGGGMGPWSLGHYKNQPGEAFVYLEARLGR